MNFDSKILRLNDTGELNDMQYWSENHQIGWKAGRYLIGQAFAENPELQNLIFEASNMNGEQNSQIGKEAVYQWLDYRSRYKSHALSKSSTQVLSLLLV